MNQSGYTIEVTGLSPDATEKDIYDFFAFSGTIEHVEIIRYGESACTAYVTFKDAHALETAVLLSGAVIVDQRVCITHWGQTGDEFDFWNRPSWKIEEEGGSTNTTSDERFVPTTGEAVTMAQDVVKTMLSKGYVLGREALSNAKAFDESHQVSATAAAKVAEMSKRIGLTDKISAGVGAVKSVDDKYRVSETTRSAVSVAGRTAAAAATTVVNSSYFSRGALYVSDALARAAKVAADLGGRGGTT
ncbi:RNA recognition motif domain [Macleaya cordata]|uniref:RNA recognition motif domain n=1 Tax=Macleaya cordata TaxID=56857 RepID=A0A200QS70_MACCD|nr:RNA recognition motif domain [Macleaya cordata]